MIVDVVCQECWECGICFVVKQIDIFGVEYLVQMNYFYFIYYGMEYDLIFGEKQFVMVLGLGVYWIGSLVEFDWCCVMMVCMLCEFGYLMLMINCNLEIVSIDYDECDCFYFEEIIFEMIQELYDFELFYGMVVFVGG